MGLSRRTFPMTLLPQWSEGDWSAYINLWCAVLGIGSLGIAGKYGEAGPVFATLGLTVMATINIYAAVVMSKCLMDCPHWVQTYTDLAHYALGPWGRVAVAILQMTFCLLIPIAFLTLGGSLLLPNIFPSADISPSLWIIIMSTVLFPLILIPTMKEAAWAGMLGTITTAIAVATTVIFFMVEEEWESPPPEITIQGVFRVFGTFALAYGAAVVLPAIQRDLEDPSRLPRVIFYALFHITCIYYVIGFLGYMVFGCAAPNNLLEALLLDKGWVQISAYGAMEVGLAVTVAILLNPALFVMERYLGIHQEPIKLESFRTTDFRDTEEWPQVDLRDSDKEAQTQTKKGGTSKTNRSPGKGAQNLSMHPSMVKALQIDLGRESSDLFCDNLDSAEEGNKAGSIKDNNNSSTLKTQFDGLQTPPGPKDRSETMSPTLELFATGKSSKELLKDAQRLAQNVPSKVQEPCEGATASKDSRKDLSRQCSTSPSLYSSRQLRSPCLENKRSSIFSPRRSFVNGGGLQPVGYPKEKKRPMSQRLKSVLFRTSVLATHTVIACALQNCFSDLADLVGSTASTGTCMIMPLVIYYKMHHKKMHVWERAFVIFMAVFSFVFACYSTFYAVQTIVRNVSRYELFEPAPPPSISTENSWCLEQAS